MVTIHLKAVDSLNASDEDLKAAGIQPHEIPMGADGVRLQLAKHQVQTIRALREGTAPIIINQAMTGDGKTLAGRFQMLNHGKQWRTFAMYPTNALVHDQNGSFLELLNMWQEAPWGQKPPQGQTISARELDDLSFGRDIQASRKEKLATMLNRKNYVLTNPDIFHLIMNFAYKQRGEASDFLPSFVANRFKLYVFDEFHLFGIEQIAAVMIAMLLIRQNAPANDPRKFLFLSATPQSLLTALANRVGIEVAEPIQGYYEHGHVQPPDGYRRILRETELTLHSGYLEDWVRDHFEDIIKPFFEEHQAATGLIIANSVATAHRIYAYLKPLCDGFIRLAINTGLTPKVDRTDDFDLLVATSTVDVGVDFKINFLVFESRDAASHTQRLGRLGRHANDKHGNPFESYIAHALLPPWVIEAVQEKVTVGDSVSRKKYQEIVEANYAPKQQFSTYVHRWAGIQAAKILIELRDKNIYAQYRHIHQDLEKDFKSLFGKSVRKYFTIKNAGDVEIIEAAASFRGASPFTALVQDPESDSKEIVSYNLITLLRRAQLQALPVSTLLKEAEGYQQNIESLKKSKPLAAYRLISWQDDYRDIMMLLDSVLTEERTECVIVQNRFMLHCASIPEMTELNKELYERNLVAMTIADWDAYSTRSRLRLGFDIELFDFSDADGNQGTIAFGRDALLLDSVYQRRKRDEQKPIIC